MRASTSPARARATARSAASWLWRVGTSRYGARSTDSVAATARILGSGPTSTGTMSPARAASIAPRSEFRSTGWTTAVLSGSRPRLAAIVRVDRRQDGAQPLHLLRGGDDLGNAVDHDLARVVHATTLEGHAMRRRILECRRHRRGDRFSDAHRSLEPESLLDVDRAGAGELRSEQRRDQCAAPHPEDFEVVAREAANEAGRIAHLDLVEGPVLDRVHRTP